MDMACEFKQAHMKKKQTHFKEHLNLANKKIIMESLYSNWHTPAGWTLALYIPQTVWPHWGVLTVGVKARCSIEVVSEASGIFPVNFRTKCLSWHVHVHFDCAGSHKMLAPGLASGIFPVNFHKMLVVNMSMCISTTQARTKCVPRD